MLIDHFAQAAVAECVSVPIVSFGLFIGLAGLSHYYSGTYSTRPCSAHTLALPTFG